MKKKVGYHQEDNIFMGNPSSSLPEAPDITSIADLNSKNTDVLSYLQNMSDLTDEEKKKFGEEYQKALKELTDKQDEGKKTQVIAGIRDDLQKLREGIVGEKRDENQEKDDSNTDENTDKTKQVLNIEKEVKGRLEDFKKNIEAKLSQPTTAPQTTPAIATGMVAGDIEFPEDWKNPPLDAIAKNPDNAVNNNFLVKILKMFGLDSWANWIIRKANDPDYGGSEEAKNIFETAIKLWDTNQSPSFKRLLNIKHLSKKELYAMFQHAEGLGLDLANTRNIEAAFGGKHLDDEKLQKYHRIHAGIGRMIAEIGEVDEIGYNPEARLTRLLEYSKDPSLDEQIEAEREKQQGIMVTAPLAIPQSTPDATTPPSPDVIKQENISELKKAEELDQKVTEARNDLTKAQALPEGTPEEKTKKEAAIKEAETKRDTALNDIKNSVTASTEKLNTILKDAESEYQTARLEREQAEKDLATTQALPDTLADKADKVKAAELALNNAKEKEKKFQEAVTTITTKKGLLKPEMSAREALVATQESESALRFARDATSIIVAGNIGGAEKEKTKEQEQKENEALTEEFTKLKGEINDTLHGTSSLDIDLPGDVALMKQKLEQFKAGKNPEKIKDLKITELEKILTHAQGKIDLIRTLKRIDQHVREEDKQRIVYENLEGDWETDTSGSWAELDDNDSRLDIDRTGFNYDDYTMFDSGTDPIVIAVGGLKEARKILLTHTEKFKGEKKFTSKKEIEFALSDF